MLLQSDTLSSTDILLHWARYMWRIMCQEWSNISVEDNVSEWSDISVEDNVSEWSDISLEDNVSVERHICGG
jgi:hypothetical protein